MHEVTVKHHAGPGDERPGYTATYTQADGRVVQAEFRWDAAQQRMVCFKARRTETQWAEVA